MNLINSNSITCSSVTSSGREVMSPEEFADEIDLSVHDKIESVHDDWKAAEKTSTISVYQRYEWVAAFLKTQKSSNNTQSFIITGRYKGEIVFILPCTIIGTLIRRLKFIGGRHVNFNMGIFPSKYAPMMTPQSMNKIFMRIRKIVPGIGYIALCCQPEHWQNTKNPMISLLHQKSSNPAFVLNLEGGFDKTLARGNAKRKRKKFRQQCRMVDELGGYEFYKPKNEKQIDEVIDAFFQQKSERLRELGISDAFSNDSVKSFVSILARKSLKLKDPLLQLYALKVDNKILAVFGGGVLNSRLSGFFSSINIHDHMAISPGEMLLYLIVQDACEMGYTQMDLGAGDERYKHSWSSETIDMYDVYLPISFFSIPIVFMRRIYGAIRCSLRSNQRIWNSFKRARLLKARIFN